MSQTGRKPEATTDQQPGIPDISQTADPALNRAISRSLEFLKNAQLVHGEFNTLLGADLELTTDSCVPDSSPFVTSLILYSLTHVSEVGFQEVIRRAIGFLLSQMEPGGVWRYYSKLQWKHPRVPPDLDDTSCVSYVLRTHGVTFPDNRWVFDAMQDHSGRYRTWMVESLSETRNLRLWVTRLRGERAARRAARPIPVEFANNPRFAEPTDPVSFTEVDPVVNANVILYLGETERTGPAIAYLIDCVRTGVNETSSVYYPDPLALYYMTGRAHLHSAPSLGAIRDRIVQDTLERQGPDGSFGRPLATALALCTLLSFGLGGDRVARGIESLINTQQQDGSWPRYTLYRGPAEFWGSEELTTALCVEAISRFSSSRNKTTARPR